MDNLTHGLAGALIAELCLRAAPKAWRPSHRTAAYVVSILANNLPDLDFVLTGLTAGKLGYLLHHRGHTHTLLGALALAVALSAGVVAWLRRRADLDWRREARALFALAVIGVNVHLLLDFGNNYGVHPFWPFDGRWYYGDLAFIVEPWWWCVVPGILYQLVETRWARLGLLAVWALGLVVPWLPPLTLEAKIYGTLLGLALFAPNLLRLSAGRRLLVGFSTIVALYTLQFGLRSAALASVRTELDATTLKVVDIVRAPLPSSPWCWDLVVVAVDDSPSGLEYVLRLGRASALPGIFPANNCPEVRTEPTAKINKVSKASANGSAVVWQGEYRVSGKAFRDGVAGCFAAAFLRYARAPFLDQQAGVIGDLRYDRVPELEFTDLELPAPGTACPDWVPSWEAPRDDVLKLLAKRAPQ